MEKINTSTQSAHPEVTPQPVTTTLIGPDGYLFQLTLEQKPETSVVQYDQDTAVDHQPVVTHEATHDNSGIDSDRPLWSRLVTTGAVIGTAYAAQRGLNHEAVRAHSEQLATHTINTAGVAWFGLKRAINNGKQHGVREDIAVNGARIGKLEGDAAVRKATAELSVASVDQAERMVPAPINESFGSFANRAVGQYIADHTDSPESRQAFEARFGIKNVALASKALRYERVSAQLMPRLLEEYASRREQIQQASADNSTNSSQSSKALKTTAARGEPRNDHERRVALNDNLRVDKLLHERVHAKKQGDLYGDVIYADAPKIPDNERDFEKPWEVLSVPATGYSVIHERELRSEDEVKALLKDGSYPRSTRREVMKTFKAVKHARHVSHGVKDKLVETSITGGIPGKRLGSAEMKQDKLIDRQIELEDKGHNLSIAAEDARLKRAQKKRNKQARKAARRNP